MKRLFHALFIAGLSAAFLFASTYLLNNQPMFYEASQRICGYIGVTDGVAIEKFCALIRYLITLTPLLWVFYFSVLLPRVNGWKKNISFLTSIGALVIGSFIAALPVTSFYFNIFSRIVYWDVDPYFTRIPVILLNLIACIAAMLLIYKKLYAPSIKAKNEKWLTGDVFFKTVARYGCIIALAHLGVWFIISLKGLLLSRFVGNMSDYILTAESDSRYFFGIVLLLIMEPLIDEVAFRGLIFEHLKKEITPGFAAVISSFLYALWHLGMGAGLETYAFLMGLMLCSVYHRTRRLRFAIFVHMGMNFLRMLCLWNLEEKLFRPLSDIIILEKKLISYVIQNCAVGLAGSLLAIILILYVVKNVPAE